MPRGKNPKRFDLSASSIASFKACPTRFRLAYREGLRLDEDTDAQRMGTNWHALHEVYYGALASADDADTALEGAVAHLNRCYESTPATKTPDEWETERQMLMVSFLGYLWYWEGDPITVMASELAFDLPLHVPRIGMPLPMDEVVRRGKIDHIILWHGLIGNLERKSTSRTIDPSSDYWEKSRKDTQVSMYALAFRDMAEGDQLPLAVTQHKCYDPERAGNTLYDVWHKPTIKPSMLTQKETATLFDTHEYRGQKFELDADMEIRSFEVRKKSVDKEVVVAVRVNGTATETKVGASGESAIRETPEMYGARLLEDIQERPEFYYQRQEIARTTQQIARFRVELYNIYQAQKVYAKTGCWYENETQCRATFPCPFIPICYGPGADHVCQTGETPQGFKRIFVDPTVEGKTLADD